MSKRSKKTSLGRSFNEMMQIMGYCEQKLAEMHRQFTGESDLAIPVQSEKLGVLVGSIAGRYDPMSDDMLDFTEALVKGWGVDAATMRSSFKYRASEGDLIHLGHQNPDIDEIELRLPFPQCVLVVTDVKTIGAGIADNPNSWNIKEMCLFFEERILDESAVDGDWYEKQGMAQGDKFISATMGALVDMEGKLQMAVVPAEFHFTSGMPFKETRWTSAVPHGTPLSILSQMENYGRSAFMQAMFWLAALYSPRIKKDMRQGLKPGVMHLPRPKQRVFYEHTMLTIDPTKVVEIKDPIGSHSKHRLHPVRGFWRQYKSGKRTWIEPHWRGDKELGVVTHDYNLEVED